MILASAIKIDINGESLVLCGSHHGDIFKQIETLDKLGVDFNKLDETQGFIDHNNNFLTREEAFKHAKMCGQLSSKIIYERELGAVGGKKLFSEDLW